MQAPLVPDRGLSGQMGLMAVSQAVSKVVSKPSSQACLILKLPSMAMLCTARKPLTASSHH